MRPRAVAAAVLVALAVPSSALAHANLLQRVPNFGARLATTPPAVSLQFDQGVDVFADSIQVRSSTGKTRRPTMTSSPSSIAA